MLHLLAARPVLAHDFCLVLPHLPRDLADHGVDGRIHVVRLRARLDGDVVAANEDDLGEVTVLLHVEDHLRLDDARVVEVQTLHFFHGVILDRVGDADMAACDFDGQIDVGDLHCILLFSGGLWVTF